MVGVTMLLVMAICIFGAAALYAALARPFSDLVPNVAPGVPISAASNASNEPAAETPAPASEPDPTVAPQAAEESAPTVAPASEEFDPTHQISAATSVNFRTGPSTNDSVIIALSPAEPLQYLDEDNLDPNGVRWMKFRATNGQEGWVSEELIEPYSP